MCLQEIKDEIIDAGKESVEEVEESIKMILSILVYTFFSRMFDLCCLL